MDFDGLFKLPLSQFTAARNALAAEWKKAGKKDDAAGVAKLPKPSIAAWAVNQLFWRHQRPFARLLEAGERFRNAQQAQIKGGKSDLRGTLDARREAMSALLAYVPAILEGDEHSATPDLMRRVTTTLDALAVYGTLPDAPPAGRLLEDLQPLGFETLAALVPRTGTKKTAGTPTRVLTFKAAKKAPKAKKLDPAEARRQHDAEVKARRAAAREKIAAAERTLKDAKKAAQDAEAVLKKAAAIAKKAQSEKDALEKKSEALSTAAQQATKDAHKVAREAEDAAQAVSDAERELDKARAALDSIPDRAS